MRNISLPARENRFTIHVATVNGSGSQTANTTLLRAVFQMGVPVSGKNLFPSNIAGLPVKGKNPASPAVNPSSHSVRLK